MNLPEQSTCFPSDAASCLPIATRSILSPSITTVAFGNTLPSAGLITVPPTREIFSARADNEKIDKAMARNFVLLFIRMEPNLAFWLFRRNHYLANRIENILALLVVLFLQRVQLASEIGIGKKHLPQAYKCPHDRNINLHRAGAA